MLELRFFFFFHFGSSHKDKAGALSRKLCSHASYSLYYRGYIKGDTKSFDYSPYRLLKKNSRFVRLGPTRPLLLLEEGSQLKHTFSSVCTYGVSQHSSYAVPLRPPNLITIAVYLQGAQHPTFR